MTVGVIFNSIDGLLTFTENGLVFDDPIQDDRFKSFEFFPAVSLMYEGDQVLFT